MKADTNNLTGKLLIAMPGMGDPRFEYALVYICAHSGDGAMGLIINKPNPKLAFKTLITQLKIKITDSIVDTTIYFGGPVEPMRGFILHSSDYPGGADTLNIDKSFSMTATPDILRDMACGNGPDIRILALGYAGWAAGQLEAELMQNGWLICDASHELVFDQDNSNKWAAALATLGVDPSMLSSQAGRA